MSSSPTWLLYITRNTWHIAGAIFWLFVTTTAAKAESTVDFQHHSQLLFPIAATFYILLLVAPARRWVRVGSLAAPVIAAWSRVWDFLSVGPLWNGATVWAFLTFVFLYAGLHFMPPPLTNGARLRWLRGEGIDGGV